MLCKDDDESCWFGDDNGGDLFNDNSGDWLNNNSGRRLGDGGGGWNDWILCSVGRWWSAMERFWRQWGCGRGSEKMNITQFMSFGVSEVFN